VVIGLGGAAGHLFVGLEEAKSGYLGMAVVARECAAVTGACLATRRDVFASLEGFDASLGVDLNDVDYCLRAQRDGLRVIFDPTVELIHHESPSRGTAGDTRDIVHFIDRWSDSILSGDPYLNPHLTRVDSSCALRGPDEKEWWQRWRSSLG
jgi:GT2 family glycosyltransferase